MRRTSGSWFESPQARLGLVFGALGIYSGVLTPHVQFCPFPLPISVRVALRVALRAVCAG